MTRASYPRVYYEIMILTCSLVLGTGLSAAFLPILSQRLDPTGTLVGAVTSAWFAVRIFTELPSGFLSDRLGRRRLILFGLSLSVFGALACATSRSVYQLILGRALWGLGFGVYFTNNTAMMLEMFDNRVRGKALGTIQSMELIGNFIGAPLGAITAATLGYYSVFYVASLMTLFSFWIGFHSSGLKKPVGKRPQHFRVVSVTEALKSLRNRALLLVCTVTLSRTLIVQGLMSTVFQLYLNQILFYDVATIGLIMSVRTVGFILATFLSGQLFNRFGSKKIIVAGLVGEGICFYLYSVASSLTSIMFLAFFEGIGGGMISLTLILTLAGVLTPGTRGVSIGLYRTFMDLGGILGPILLIFAYDSVGRQVPFLASAFLLLANAALVVLVRPHQDP